MSHCHLYPLPNGDFVGLAYDGEFTLVKNPSTYQTDELSKNPTETVSGIVCANGDVYAWPERKADHGPLGIELQRLLDQPNIGKCFTAYKRNGHWKVLFRSFTYEFKENPHFEAMFNEEPIMRFNPQGWQDAVAAAEIRKYKNHPQPGTGVPLPIFL